ncbi:MAG: hypothetical protein IJ662_09330 [Clostridia bacterium]|nr:hypothetical protein [Clostridia bacterium]
MTKKDKQRKTRNPMPDLNDVASATECTGILPAQTPEHMPDPGAENMNEKATTTQKSP